MISNSINYIIDNFDASQKRHYRFFTLSSLISKGLFFLSIILCFFTSFWIVVIGIIQMWIINSLVLSCVNCLSNKTDITDEKQVEYLDYKFKRSSPVMVLIKQTHKCRKCDFTWNNLFERTGHLDGIGKMSKDIKNGGKSRFKGESYINWWKRNKG